MRTELCIPHPPFFMESVTGQEAMQWQLSSESTQQRRSYIKGKISTPPSPEHHAGQRLYNSSTMQQHAS